MRLEEIVVTAQKRSQNVQEVPISVTALSGEALREMNIQGVTELTIAMPNATLAVSPSFSTIYVRGIGTGLNDGFEPSVGLYVDNIYMGRQSYLNDALMDIEVVELLRGPQGTLFGKNSAGGAVRITGYYGMAIGLVPTVAPLLGGYVFIYAGWQANFLLLSMIAGAVLAMTFFHVPETLPPPYRRIGIAEFKETLYAAA